MASRRLFDGASEEIGQLPLVAGVALQTWTGTDATVTVTATSGLLENVTDDFTFTGTDGAAWGPGWTFVQGSGDILTNRGRMVTGTGAFDGDSAVYDTGLADAVVSIDVEIPTNDAQFPEVRFRFSDVNYDFIRLVLEPHNDLWYVHDFDNDVLQTLLANGSFAVAAGDVVHVKCMGVGTALFLRLWLNADPEPATWTATFTSSLGASNTQFMVRTVTSNLGVAVTNFWDNLAVSSPWVGTDATVTVTATSGLFSSGGSAQTWTGTDATVTVTGGSGTFTPGPATWTGTDATATVTATSGLFAPGSVTWVGADATVTVAGDSGLFSAAGTPQTWTGTDATVTVTATSGLFAAGPVTWTGTDATATVTATSGLFAAGGAPQTWTGTDATATITATSGSWAPGTVTWVGTDGTITVASASGVFTISGTPQTWAGTGATATITATSGSFIALVAAGYVCLDVAAAGYVHLDVAAAGSVRLDVIADLVTLTVSEDC